MGSLPGDKRWGNRGRGREGRQRERGTLREMERYRYRDRERDIEKIGRWIHREKDMERRAEI